MLSEIELIWSMIENNISFCDDISDFEGKMCVNPGTVMTSINSLKKIKDKILNKLKNDEIVKEQNAKFMRKCFISYESSVSKFKRIIQFYSSIVFLKIKNDIELS